MSEFTEFVREASEGSLNGASDGIILAMSAVIGLIVIASVVALFVSIFLAVSYIKYNRRKNSAHMTGEQIARRILDQNGLERIKVSVSGSILFGNSYSHYFKKVRLRRLTWKKDSVTSLTMAAQKSALAILDKEGDPDMRRRVRITPLIYLGPLACVPLIIVGVLLDLYVFSGSDGKWTILLTVVGFLFYLLSFIMSMLVLKTERKAQDRALVIMKTEGLATQEELDMSRKLFKLYNIEYVNNMVIALLELIYRALQIIAYAQGNSPQSQS